MEKDEVRINKVAIYLVITYRSSGDQAKVVYDGNLAAVKWSSDPIYESADGVAIVPNPSYGDSIKVTTAYSNPEFYMSHESKVNDDIYEYEN